MTAIILSLLGRWLGGALAILALAGVIYLYGRSEGREAVEAEQRQQAADTKERVDEAIRNSRSGGSDWRDRLRTGGR